MAGSKAALHPTTSDPTPLLKYLTRLANSQRLFPPLACVKKVVSSPRYAVHRIIPYRRSPGIRAM
jgi:hypothetical protein